MSKVRLLLRRLGDWLDPWVMYAFTLVGVLVSSYIPELKTKTHISIELDTARILIAGIVALVVTRWDEGKVDGEHKIGRRNNFKKRMVRALVMGIGWQQSASLVTLLGGLL
jgi:hypothetical protein